MAAGEGHRRAQQGSLASGEEIVAGSGLSIPASELGEALTRARNALEKQDFQAVLDGVNDALYCDPQNAEAAFIFGCSMLAAEQPAVARWAFIEALRQEPRKWAAMSNLGRAYQDLERYEMAENHYRESLKMQPGNLPGMMGMSTVCVQTGRYRECIEWADKAEKITELTQQKINRGFAHLHLDNVAEGWREYAKGVGFQQWRERKYHFRDDGTPEGIWAGQKDAKILITAEQGIGDQIAFLSVVPDMIELGYHIAAIECGPKLRNLIQRSFKQFPVHGTQFIDPPGWRVPFTHSCSMSELMQYFRRSPRDYPKQPYLTVEDDQVAMWRHFLDSKGSMPHIGIAWRGGSRRSTNWRHKSVELEVFKPVFEAFPGAHFVSLEYKDPGNLSDWPLDHYQWATMTDDYENTAALVKNLDAIVTVPTSVNHLAGALGVPAFCLMSESPHFHYATEMPYYGTVNLFKRWDIDGLINSLREHLEHD